MAIEIFSSRLRIVREKRGLSQRELARRSGLGLNQINRYESQAIEPTISALQAIARELNVSTDYLLGFVSELHEAPAPGTVDANEEELTRTFRQQGWPGVIRLGAEHLSK